MSKKIKKYTILKGWHYSNFIPSFKLIDDVTVFEHKIAFDQSCKYEIDEPSCVNKLFGFCFGFGVHQESIRFGWTYDKTLNEYTIWHYVYSDGELYKFPIKSFTAKGVMLQDYKIVLKRRPNNTYIMYRHAYDYTLYIDGTPLAEGRIKSNKLFLTTLGPYFGGHTRAPHKMVIKELKS